MAERRFHRLLTRLVFQDASRKMAWFLGVLVMTQGFILKYIPPPVIREAIQTSRSTSRAIFLAVVLLLYAWATRPLTQTLIGSHRLQFFLHLPFSPRQWMWAHLRHLCLVHLPWFAIAGYGIFGGPGSPGWGLGLLWWAAWCCLTLALLLAAHHTGHPRSLRWAQLAWCGAPFALYLSFVSPHAVGAVAILVASVVWIRYGILLPPPPRKRRVGRWRVPWKAPWLLLLRLEWWTLMRRGQAVLLARIAAQVVCLGLFALAIYNNQLRAPGLLSHIAMGVLLPCVLLGASCASAVQELRIPFGWWDEHLGFDDAQMLSARWGIGLVANLWLPLGLALALWIGGAALPWTWWGLWSALLAAMSVWATALCCYLGWNAQLHRKLHEGIFWGLLVHGFPVLLGVIWFPQWGVLWFGLPTLFYGLKGAALFREQRNLSRLMPEPRASSLHHQR